MSDYASRQIGTIQASERNAIKVIKAKIEALEEKDKLGEADEFLGARSFLLFQSTKPLKRRQMLIKRYTEYQADVAKIVARRIKNIKEIEKKADGAKDCKAAEAAREQMATACHAIDKLAEQEPSFLWAPFANGFSVVNLPTFACCITEKVSNIKK